MNIPETTKSIGSSKDKTLKIAFCYDPLNEYNQNIQTNAKITMDFIRKS